MLYSAARPTQQAHIGQPADNAVHFVEWLSALKADELSGVSFAVFGCGNRDWVQTYQRIPTLCDKLLADRGGKRLLERGEGDASAAEFFEVFDEWEKAVWEKLGKVRTHLRHQPCNFHSSEGHADLSSI